MEYLLALSRSVLWRCLVHGWENATWVSKHQTCLWNMPLQYIRKIGMVQERILYLYSRTCVSRPPHWPYKIWCLNISVGGLWRQVPVLRDLCHNNTCLEGPLVFGRRSHISMWMNLSSKTTCLERQYFLWPIINGAVFHFPDRLYCTTLKCRTFFLLFWDMCSLMAMVSQTSFTI